MDGETEEETGRKAQREGRFGKRTPVSAGAGQVGRTRVLAQHRSGASAISLHSTGSGLPQNPAPLPPRVGSRSPPAPCLALADLGWYKLCNRGPGPKRNGFPSLQLGLQSLQRMDSHMGGYVFLEHLDSRLFLPRPLVQPCGTKPGSCVHRPTPWLCPIQLPPFVGCGLSLLDGLLSSLTLPLPQALPKGK